MHKDLRLRRPELFKKVYEQGKSVATKEAVLYYLCVGEQVQARAGFSVSKKVGNAVVRNKLRRRLKNIYAAVADRVEDGWLLVVIGRPRAADVAFCELEDSVHRLLRRARIFKEDQ